jgi:dipeptidase
MGCDMVVALGRATADGQTLFGHNSDRPLPHNQLLRRVPGREFAAGEKTQAQFRDVWQVRQTWTVVGCQPHGWWGYCHGANEHGVAAGSAVLRTVMPGEDQGLTGGDLVRLALERGRTARHAVDCLTGLVERYGQTAWHGEQPAAGGDHAFLVADAREAFAVETAGRHWVCQEVQEVRAASNASVIHQDWDSISRGLAGSAIDRGWWPADGSKLDFAGTLSCEPMGQASGMRRWGRATYLLEQQNGHIDAGFVRRLMGDHYEGTHFEWEPGNGSAGPTPICQHGEGPGAARTGTGLVAQPCAGGGRLPVLGWAFGPPCGNVYLPLFVEGELPAALTGPHGAPHLGRRLGALAESARQNPAAAAAVRDAFEQLQARFDREAEEFAREGAMLKGQGDRNKLAYLAGAFMQQALERFEWVLNDAEAAVRRTSETPTDLFVGGLSPR